MSENNNTESPQLLEKSTFKQKLQHRLILNSFSANQEPLQTCSINTSKPVHWQAAFLSCS